MTQRSTGPRSLQLHLCWVLLFALVAAGVFWLPYHVPVTGAAVSDSAKVGFNNLVAMASVLIGLAGATILSLFAPLLRQDNSGQVATQASTEVTTQAATGQIGIRPLVLACSIQTATLLLIQGLQRGAPPIGEAAFFLDRLYYLSRGITPYSGFEFPYGPAMLYLPYWLQHVLGLSTEIAYAWCVWVFGFAGNCILWALIRQSRAGYRTKLAAFVCLATWLTLALALQYTLLRYVCGLGALAFAAAVIRRGCRWYLLPPIYVGLTLAVLLISPEIGCAFIPGLLVYLVLELGISHELFRTAGIYLLLGGCVIGLLPGGLFLALRGFAGGGGGLPLLPSPYLLLYLGTLLAVVPPILADAPAILRGKGVSASRPFGGPLTIAFAVQSICLIPGALGRADIGHVYFYGIGVFLLAILGGWPQGRWQPVYWIAILAIFQVLGIGMGLRFLLPGYMSTAGQQALRWVDNHPASAVVRYARSAAGDARWTALQARLRRVRDLNLESHESELAGLGPICAPFGDAEAYSILSPHNNLQTEYYHGLDNVFTTERVQHKIAGTRSCTYLLMRNEGVFDEVQSPSHPNALGAELRWVLCFPWLPPLLEPGPPNPLIPFFEVIRSEYVLARQLNSRWVLWARR